MTRLPDSSRSYLLIGAALLILLALTVAAAQFDLDPKYIVSGGFISTTSGSPYR